MPRRSTTIILAGVCASAVLLGAAAGSLAASQQPRAGADARQGIAPAGAITTQATLTLEGARRAGDAAAAYAREHGAGGAIAVVDSGGATLYLIRLDGTFPAASEVSIAKARTAAQFRKPTQAFENAIRDGRVSLTAVAPMTPLEGGVPIVIEGQVVGAIGCSGAMSSTQDVEVATAGANAVMGG